MRSPPLGDPLAATAMPIGQFDHKLNEEGNMRITSLLTVAVTCTTGGLLAGLGLAWAAVGLDAYVDQNGFIDVQELTCDQLANTYQEDANALANWYSGWYNGLAKKHYYHLTRVAGVEHELILWCEAHRERRIIEGLGFLAHEGRGPR